MRFTLLASCLVLLATSASADVTRNARHATPESVKLQGCKRGAHLVNPALISRDHANRTSKKVRCVTSHKPGPAPKITGAAFAIGVYR